MLFANATLCDDLAKKNPRCCDTLEALLSSQPFLCGDTFSLADVSVATYLAWMPYFTKCDPAWRLAERWPALGAYVARVLARPGGECVPLAWLDDTAAWLV